MILVGERTRQSSIQQVLPLGEGWGAVRLNIANYYTPSSIYLERGSFQT